MATVPSLVTDLSTTAASNWPAGSDNVFPSLDNGIRALSAFVASISAGSATNGYTTPYLLLAGGTVTGATSFTATLNAGTTGLVGSVVDIGGVRVSQRTGAGQVALMEFAGNGNTVGSASLAVGQTATGDGQVINRANKSLYLGTNGTIRVQLDQSGNFFIAESSLAPTTSGSGGVLYVESGALKYRGSTGTVTTIAAA